MNPRRFFFAGLPASGKSTYLTAFWVYANGATGSELSVEVYPDNNQYLIELQKHWFNFTAVPRTPAHSEREVKLMLRRNSDGQLLEIQIPDLSGETFAQIWSGRHWSTHFQSLVDGSDGMVFFLHSQKIEAGTTLEQVRQIARAVGDDEPAEGPVNTIATEWDINKSPTDVQIVDCLQLISEYAQLRRPFRLALVISAWDVARRLDPAAEPSKWLQARLPLLAQFLEANPATFETAVFGVSAQGGDYETEKATLEKKAPHDRAFVVGPTVKNEADITTPLQWLTR